MSIEYAFHDLQIYLNHKWLLRPRKITVYLSVVATIMCFVGCITGPGEEASNTFAIASAYYSGTWTQFFFITNESALLDLTEKMKNISRSLEGTACLQTSEDMRKVASSVHRILRFFRIWTWLTIAGIVFLPIIILKPICHSWPDPTTTPTLILAMVGQSVAGFYGIMTGLQFVNFLFCVGLLNSCMFRAVGRLVEQIDAHQLIQISRIHQIVCHLWHNFEKMQSRWLAHILVALLTLPMLVINDFISGRGFGLSLVAGPCIIYSFIPWCVMGNEIQDDSLAISFHAYSGKWIEESSYFRKIRLTIMMRAGQPSQLTVYGLGVINLPTCMNVLKTWFSYLQLLTKFN